MHIFAACLIGVCLAYFQSGQVSAAESNAIDPSGYDLTFDEPFDTLRVSPEGPGTHWTARLPWQGTFGDARFVSPSADFPFTVDDGILRIEMRKGSDQKWSSGLLASVDPSGQGFSQQYGYFEMRAKLPGGPGVWPAFWLIGLNRDTHTSEIDVLEHHGAMPGSFAAAIHVWDRKNSSQSVSDHKRVLVPAGSLYDTFHTYGVSVDADTLRFYFDRRLVWEKPTPPEFRQPFFILVNLSCGSGWPIDQMPNPSYMYVDYIRAYALP